MTCSARCSPLGPCSPNAAPFRTQPGKAVPAVNALMSFVRGAEKANRTLARRHRAERAGRFSSTDDGVPNATGSPRYQTTKELR